MPDLNGVFKSAIEKGAQGDLPWIIVLFVFTLLQWMLIKLVYKPMVDSKNEEIQRLVKERKNKFQDLVLKHRLHTNIDESGRSTPSQRTGRGKG